MQRGRGGAAKHFRAPDVAGPGLGDARTVYESDTKSIIRNKGWENSLHTSDLRNPFFIVFFIAAWIFTLIMWWQRGFRAALITFFLVFLINVTCLALKERNPFLIAVRYFERRFNKYHTS
eukprot:EC691238.1.p2 GENE.EC691238.1~~EC691238.1.p2  ORF type:complete len:120 (+),score=37.44 EC691238.1:70-429(+)